MPQSLTPLSSANGNGEAPAKSVIRAISPPPSPSSATARAARSGRSKRGGSSVARRRLRRVLDNTQKHYAPHTCRFAPYRPPAAVMLDPFPSLRINGLCMAGLATLVTVHRSGVRLYRERHLPSAASPLSSSASLASLAALRSAPLPFSAATSSSGAGGGGGSTASGVFEQLEARNDFQVRESYLCTAMQPVLMDKAVLLSKWSRYFCVASGNDRVVHSVAVMSSGAHFCLHHERHQTNKVVCMHCTQVATEPFHPAILKPAVVSVDEVGMAVLFDVEREMPAVLERAPLWFRQVDRTNEEGATGEEVDGEGVSHPRQPFLLEQQLSPEEEDHVLEAMERVPVKERATYHFDHGAATRVTLVGPCLELCNHCHNAFMSLAPTRGYLLVSIYISSRARDVQCEDGGHNAATPVSSSCATASAELNVVLLRVLWGPRRAFVLEEVRLVREAAPTDVCEAGVATAARPYQVGLPITLLLARPALSLWQLHACTGAGIDTRHLYASLDAKKSSSDRHGGSKSAAAPRSASEFIIHWVPLGRHRLTMQHDDRIGPQSWFCIAAVTDDDTVLLLGRAPQSCRTSPTQPQPPVQSPARPVTQAAATSAEKFTDANLEGWLDDLNPSSLPSPLAEDSRTRRTKTASTAAAAPASSETPYTVLMQLYSPSGASAAAAGASASASAPSVAAGVVSIMPDLHDNRLILFMADEEALVSVPLPFADRIATLTDSDPQQEGEGEEETSNTRGAAGVDLSGAAETIATNGYSQYLWGATSKAVTAASQGWSSSVQRWAPSSSSYFSFAGSGGGSASPVREAGGAPPAASASPPLATTQAAAAEPYHAFSIARPLMAAVFHFTGEDKETPSTTAPAAVLSQRAAPPLPPALPAEATAQPPSSSLHHNQRQGSPDARSASEASTSAAATAVSAATSLAVPIRVAFGQREGSRSRAASSNSSRHSGHRRRLPYPHRVASSASLHQGGEEGEDAVTNADGDDGAASTTRGGGDAGRRRHRRSGLPAVQEVRVGSPAAQVTMEDTTAQTSYMEQQMALLTEEVKENGDGGVSSLQKDAGRRPALRTLEELQYVLRRLVDVDEPLERNMVLYSWKDGHNDLYIRLCVGQDALEQAQAKEDAAVAAAGNEGHISPRANRSASPHVTHGEPLRFVTHTSAEVVDGVHSVGFLEQYHSAATWRTSTASYGNCFNFTEYFSTLQVPQHVLDVQERDKCRLELEDLRLQQVRDMASVHPFAVMTVCQNEERVSADAEWRLHATFPYDDERDGRVVDLNRLNRNAGSQRGAAAGGPEWRWATAKEARIWAEEEGEGGGGSSGRSQLLTRRVRSLVKEQKDWAVGPWEYAERWPPHTSTGAAATSAWCSAEAPAHRCRRRRLRRLRVNVDELRRQTELTASHVRELGALREELGL